MVVAEQFDAVDTLTETVLSHTRARAVLGPASREQVAALLGAEPRTTPPAEVPPGRGYVRLGTGPVLRLQVPATPDPYDDATSDAHRQAVLDLLPGRHTPAEAEAAWTADEEGPITERTPVAVEAAPRQGDEMPVEAMTDGAGRPGRWRRRSPPGRRAEPKARPGRTGSGAATAASR